jgi:hypothetical protein
MRKKVGNMVAGLPVKGAHEAIDDTFIGLLFSKESQHKRWDFLFFPIFLES